MTRTASLTLIGIATILIGHTLAANPADIESTLAKAGDNRGQLETVLAHYQSGEDTLAYAAVCFLIGNMEGHSYVTYRLMDTAGATVELNVLDFETYDELQAVADSLERVRGVIDYEKLEVTEDATVITAAFLINHIDAALSAWREKPWAKRFSFDHFCEYILPYRGSNEPLEEWRATFLEKYAQVENTVADPTDPIGAARAINEDIKTWFGFDARYYFHPTDQGLSEMLESGLGRCEDMTNVTIYAMRANGLAITSDYTPYWANTGNNHAWNAIASPDGTVSPFMGAEASPGSYNLSHKAAKVYRKTFGKQKQNLVFQEHKQEAMPRWLSRMHYRDVSADYMAVSDVIVELTREIPDSVDIAYLCVFNSGAWQPIHWGKIEGGKAVFTDMGRGVAYLPVLYLNEEAVPWGAPFILDDDGSQLTLLSVDTERSVASLLSTTKRKQTASTEDIAISSLSQGQTYELFFWQDGWESLGTSEAGEGPLTFDSVPSGVLYWMVAKDSNREERIFTLDDGQQTWW